MSWKVLAKVYEKRVGSQIKKAVMSYCADKASDDGRGIWASKGTIAAELEAGRSTIIRAFNELVEAGLLVPEATRRCANGSTVEYRIDLAALAALPGIERPNTRPVPERDQYRSKTSPERDQSQSGTPPVPQRDPDQSQSGTQTSLGTSLEQRRGGSAGAREADPMFRERLLAACGADPASGLIGPNGRRLGTEPDMVRASRWITDLGLTEDQVIDSVTAIVSRKRDGPPSSFAYFDQALSRLAAEIASAGAEQKPAPLKAITGGRHDRADQRHREDQAIDEYIRRRASGEIDLGPDPSDPFGGG